MSICLALSASPLFAQASFSGTIQSLGSGFSGPAGVAVDNSGNVFVADSANNAIKEIMAADGSIRVIQGGGVPAGPRSLALDKSNNLYIGSAATTLTELRAPAYSAFSTYGTGFIMTQGLAVDSSGDVFAAVSSSNSIMELVATGGAISNGSLQRSWKNTAWFNSATGIAFDSIGNLYVADPIDHAVKELSALSGQIPASPAVLTIGSGFNTPFALAFDSSNNLYIAEVANGGASPAALKEAFAVGGYTNVSTLASNFVAGTLLANPNGLAVAQNNIYVADTNFTTLGVFSVGAVDYGTIALAATGRQYSIPFYYHNTGNLNPAGPIVLLNGTIPSADFFDIGSGTCKSMQSTYQNDHCTVDIIFKPAQYGTRTATVQIEDMTGAPIAKASLKGTGTTIETSISNSFDHPEGLALDASGNLYVADTLNRRIVNATGTGTYISAAVAFGGFAFDSAGNLFYGDMLHNTVNEVTAASGYTSSIAVVKGLSGPRAVAIDKSNNLYIADANNGLLKQAMAPSYTTVNQLATFQTVVYPVAIAVSKNSGNILVSNGSGLTLFTPMGTGFTSQRLTAYFSGTAGIALDSNDNLFVVETGSASVKMLSGPAYNGSPITIPLPSTAQPLLNPQGIVVDSNDTIYVADTNNGRVAKISLTAIGPLQ